MKKPKAIILAGYGLNCEEETKYAFELAGAAAEIVHLNDIISQPKKLDRFQILAVPGGFAYGDDTGSGKAYGQKLKNGLGEALLNFVKKDRLVIGICNGFQVLTNTGLLPGALVFNNSARYTDRWVDLEVQGDSPWLKGVKTLSAPIAHGEGKYYADAALLRDLEKNNRVAVKYASGEACAYQDLAANPNGSLKNIAGVLGAEGRILGMMPHPERALFSHHLPWWQQEKERLSRTGRRLPEKGPGQVIFENGVKYFK